jgi:hypothetical protein
VDNASRRWDPAPRPVHGRLSTKGSRRRRWSRPNPVQILLTLGGIAGAILSIAGVVALVTPDEEPSPRGSFESVSADPGQGLAEFSARQETAAVHPVSHVVSRPAQLTQSTEPADPGVMPEVPPETTPTEPTPTEPLPTPPVELQTDQQLLAELEQRLPTETLPGDWEVGDIEGGSNLLISKEECEQSFSWVQGGCEAADADSAVVAAEELVRVFRATRTRSVAASGKTEPVGAAVNFNLTLENLKDRTVEVRWSMYRVGAGSPLPRDWLVNRRVFRERIERSSQTVSSQFWVPLPREPGSYFVRLSAWDGDNRLDYEDSAPPFR